MYFKRVLYSEQNRFTLNYRTLSRTVEVFDGGNEKHVDIKTLLISLLAVQLSISTLECRNSAVQMYQDFSFIFQ